MVKDPSIPLAEVEKIANAHERIDRCEFSGEILSGCNRYVHVGYSREAQEVQDARVRPAVDAAIARLEGTGGEKIEGTDFTIYREDGRFKVFGGKRYCQLMWDAATVARYVGHEVAS